MGRCISLRVSNVYVSGIWTILVWDWALFLCHETERNFMGLSSVYVPRNCARFSKAEQRLATEEWASLSETERFYVPEKETKAIWEWSTPRYRETEPVFSGLSTVRVPGKLIQFGLRESSFSLPGKRANLFWYWTVIFLSWNLRGLVWG
jgi:hypothetical protein